MQRCNEMRLHISVLFLIAACGRERIDVSTKASDDYKHGALVAAVDKFVAAKRTPEAFAELTQTITTLRPNMDRTVGKEAELKLVTLALPPVQANAGKTMRQKVEKLALTVWPALIAPPVAADQLLMVHDAKAPQLLPKPGEDPDQYIQRLCGEPLAGDCKRVVPELQAYVVEALAIRRATERVRIAVGECLPCTNDDAWKQTVNAWEDRKSVV